jgi:hypothetical protein
MTPSGIPDNYNDLMLALRYVYLLALVFLLGGLLGIGGIAAPAIFAALTAAHGSAGREMAGVAFGAVLARFHVAASVSLLLMLVALGVTAALGPRPLKFAVRMGILVVMAAATLCSGQIVSPQVDALRREIGGVVAELPAGDARRIRFGRLHGLSTALLSITAAGGLALLYWEARAHE